MREYSFWVDGMRHQGTSKNGAQVFILPWPHLLACTALKFRIYWSHEHEGGYTAYWTVECRPHYPRPPLLKRLCSLFCPAVKKQSFHAGGSTADMGSKPGHVYLAPVIELNIPEMEDAGCFLRVDVAGGEEVTMHGFMVRFDTMEPQIKEHSTTREDAANE